MPEVAELAGWFNCTKCAHGRMRFSEEKNHPVCSSCGFVAGGSRAVWDLESGCDSQTDAHYTLQWGRDVSFFDFLEKNPKAKAVTTGRLMGWPDLFDEILARAKITKEPLFVYDAACGFGGIARELVTAETANTIRYVGADIHHSLDLIAEKVPLLSKSGALLKWDISQPLPTDLKFDYIMCRQAIHHTPDPLASFKSLVSRLKPGGRIAISVYRKKSIGREALDDAFRDQVVPMSPEDAFATVRQFTLLGKYLQQIEQTVKIEEALPLLGIPAGEQKVQTLFYNHFLKCFFNPLFGEDFSTLVNYDWYHPPFAYRYRKEEIEVWFADAGLKIEQYAEIEAQMYFLAQG